MPTEPRTRKEASRNPSTAYMLLWALLSGCIHKEPTTPRLAPECKEPGPMGPDTIPCRVSPEWVRQQAAPPVHPLIQAAFSDESTALWPKIPLASVEESLMDSHRILLAGRLVLVDGKSRGGEFLKFLDVDSDGYVDEVEELILGSGRSTTRIARDTNQDGRPDQRELLISFQRENEWQHRMATLDEQLITTSKTSTWSMHGYAWLQSNIED